MFNPNYRYIALDFETTGLDIQVDEPIQIGIVEFNPNGKIIWEYQSLIKPQKDIKELKSIVGFITGLNIQELQSAPSCEQVEEEIAQFFGEKTVVIGHNIWFDLAFLEKYFKKLSWHEGIDTFPLAQTLIHYAPSYALEILGEQLKKKANFIEILKKLELYQGVDNFHNALFDAKLSTALFLYLVERIVQLGTNYPLLQQLFKKNSWSLSQLISFWEETTSSKEQQQSLPLLKKIAPAHISMQDCPYQWDITPAMHGKRFSIKQLLFSQLLTSLAHKSPCILSFSNKSKLDIAKNLLNELGIKNIGFAKEDQTFNSVNLNRFASKKQLHDAELNFLIKYFSHYEQGLGVLDLNSKPDYEIYTAIKEQRKTVNYPIILTTHTGLFSLLEQEGKYKDYPIYFFDCEWWYKSYNFYLSRPYDPNYTLNYLDMLEYKYQLAAETEGINPTLIDEFKQFFTLFVGVLGQETKKFFTNTDATKLSLGPIAGNLAFHQTNKLCEKLEAYQEKMQAFLNEQEFQTLWNQVLHFMEIINWTLTIEKKMQGKSDFSFVYAEEVQFTDRDEFLDIFSKHTAIFLSNFDQSIPPLAEPLPKQEKLEENIGEEKAEKKRPYYPMSNIASVVKAISEFPLENTPRPCIFILSVRKDQSKELFESFIQKGFNKDYLLLAENITWGNGKNIFKAQNSGAKIMIGGYNFLLQLFAQKIMISQFIIYNNRGNQQDLILNDLLRYGYKNFS